MTLAVGDAAPSVRTRSQHGETLDLSERLPALVVFFPFAFSSICSSELAGLSADPEFAAAGVHVLGVSCDPIYSLRAMADANELNLVLLSDFWPHGQIAQDFGCFDKELGAPSRSSFLIDESGYVRWAVHHSMGHQRSPELHRQSLENL